MTTDPNPSHTKTLIIAVHDDLYFLSHRLEVGRGAVAAGWHVIIAAGENGGESVIRREGMEYYPLPFRGNCMSASVQTGYLIRLTRLFREHPGAIVHLVGMKMLLVGNVAARLAGGVKGIVNAVCGLGIVFQNPDAFRPRLLLRMLRGVMLHERTLPNAEAAEAPSEWRRGVSTIVQNRDDEALLLRNGVIRDEEVEYIKGAGVDLKRFKVGPEKDAHDRGDLLKVIFSGRLLHSKGVGDVLKAAEILRKDWEGKVRFVICGTTTRNPDSLSVKEIRAACDGEYIRWEGHCEDMAPMLGTADIMVHPSYYREGVPLAVIEASAAGLPIITCDSVGCRDTIDGNGILVPPRAPEALAAAIESLLLDPERRRRYGIRSRQLAERDYDVRHVVGRHLDIYDRLLQM